MSQTPDPSATPDAAEEAMTDGVAIRTMVVRGLPLLVASIDDGARGGQLLEALEERGLPALTGFLGAPLPQGARIGFMLDGTELKLLDERETTLLRARQDGVDQDWLTHARRLKGTMTVVLRGGHPEPTATPPELARICDDRAAAGRAWGAIVGVAEERPSLPMIF
ncbi:MAG: hypothetical protein JJT89_13235 [Nitriliruptoraceae bacterium]|nr:hypothetical protein [Nitriliruptoraceae bacterium]